MREPWREEKSEEQTFEITKGRGNIKPWHFPPEVVYLFYNRKISPRDFVVLGVINALTHMRGDGTISMCYASNRYIGERCGLTSNYTSEVISNLVDLGILIRKFREMPNGSQKRYLKPFWRRKVDKRK